MLIFTSLLFLFAIFQVICYAPETDKGSDRIFQPEKESSLFNDTSAVGAPPNCYPLNEEGKMHCEEKCPSHTCFKENYQGVSWWCCKDASDDLLSESK